MLFFSKHKESSVEITISNRTVLRVLLMVIASFLLLAAMRKASHALTLLFIAFFLALALNAPVHWLAQRLPGSKRGSRTMATTVSFLFVIILLSVFLVSIVPPLVKQTADFIQDAPSLVNDLRDVNTPSGRFIERYGLEKQLDELTAQLSSSSSSITGSALSTLSRITSNVVSFVTVLVLTFMMLTEGPRWLRFSKRLVSEDKAPWAEGVVKGMYDVVKGYVNGQVILAVTAAVLITPVFFILGISYPIALLVIVFICGLIPMVGHTIGAVFVSLVALFTSPLAALIVLAYYITYQQIENYAIQPKIQANSTNMSPLLVFASVIIGVSLNGLLGGLVAIPVAGCLRIVLLDYLERNNYISTTEAKVAKSTAKAS
ncbi:MAG: AI-2E family transporter [bacterium]|nr:AI-2E family transporter [bacterium]